MGQYVERITTDEAGNVIKREVVTSKTRVKCEICQEVIATIDLLTINAPIYGWMFTSPDPFHGYPDPFPPDVPWEFMKCPHCRNRPFLADDPETCVIVMQENNTPLFVRKRPEALEAAEDGIIESTSEAVDAASLVDGVVEVATTQVEEQEETESTETSPALTEDPPESPPLPESNVPPPPPNVSKSTVTHGGMVFNKKTKHRR